MPTECLCIKNGHWHRRMMKSEGNPCKYFPKLCSVPSSLVTSRKKMPCQAGGWHYFLHLRLERSRSAGTAHGIGPPFSGLGNRVRETLCEQPEPDREYAD